MNIYSPNGNPVGTEKFAYKLAWMDRLAIVMKRRLKSGEPTVVAEGFNMIPEDIDRHKPCSWMHDALFQPEPRARCRAMLASGYIDAFRALHPDETGQFTFWDYFRRAFEYNRGIRAGAQNLTSRPSCLGFRSDTNDTNFSGKARFCVDCAEGRE